MKEDLKFKRRKKHLVIRVIVLLVKSIILEHIITVITKNFPFWLLLLLYYDSMKVDVASFSIINTTVYSISLH